MSNSAEKLIVCRDCCCLEPLSWYHKESHSRCWLSPSGTEESKASRSGADSSAAEAMMDREETTVVLRPVLMSEPSIEGCIVFSWLQQLQGEVSRST